MNGSDRSEYWRGLVLEQASSGESIASFCRVRGLSQASFYSWRKRLREMNETPQFAPVSVIDCSALEVRFPGGVTMRVPRDQEWIRCVVNALCDRGSDA